MPVAIATQLVSRGIDTLTARDLDHLGEDDVDQLQVATESGRVLCTYDSDFIGLAKTGVKHAGIVIAKQKRDHIGAIVEYLDLLHSVYRPEEMVNILEYL